MTFLHGDKHLNLNSPKRVDLAGFLHGHPGADETRDQTADQKNIKNKLQTETQKDKKRTNKDTRTRERSAEVHFLFNLSFIHHDLMIHFS